MWHKRREEVLFLLKKRQVISFSLSRYNIFTGCPQAKTCTLILRGGAEQFIEETERSLHDAIMIVRRAIKNDAVVAGGGAIEMELSKYLRDYSRSIAGKEQLLIGVMARALEIIPRQLCDNAGFDATNILNKLRQKHFQGKKLSLFSLLNFRCCLVLTHFVSMMTCSTFSTDELSALPSTSAEENRSREKGSVNIFARHQTLLC